MAVSPLILREGKNLGITSPKIFWEPLLSANFKVKALTRVRKTGFQSLVFQIGMVLIGFNVMLLGIQPLISSSSELAKWILLLIAFLNIAFGFLMYAEIKKAV